MDSEEYWAELCRYADDLEVEYEAIAKGYQSRAEGLIGKFEALSVDAQADVIVKMKFKDATMAHCVDRGNAMIRDSQRALVNMIIGEPVDY